MADTTTYYCFTSDLFQIEPGEEDLTNPQLYGKQLAHWLADKLAVGGYPDTKAVSEDWGWCVICYREPFMLWIGCGNSEVFDDPAEIEKKTIIWECFVAAEVPFWKRIFGKLDTNSQRRALDQTLRNLLTTEPRIRIVECP